MPELRHAVECLRSRHVVDRSNIIKSRVKYYSNFSHVSAIQQACLINFPLGRLMVLLLKIKQQYNDIDNAGKMERVSSNYKIMSIEKNIPTIMKMS